MMDRQGVLKKKKSSVSLNSCLKKKKGLWYQSVS